MIKYFFSFKIFVYFENNKEKHLSSEEGIATGKTFEEVHNHMQLRKNVVLSAAEKEYAEEQGFKSVSVELNITMEIL